MHVSVTSSFTPRRLYKYRAIPRPRTKEAGWLKDILVGHQLYFPKPSELNDPFDCFPSIRSNDNPEHLRRVAEGIAEKRKLDGAERDALIAQVSRLTPEVMRSEDFRQGAYHAFGLHRDQMRIFCLSERYDSALMWSHYADSHKGMVLVFDTNADPFREAERVEYRMVRPHILSSDRGHESMRRTLLVKAEDWRYEQEWRITRVSGSATVAFPPAALVAIIFGAKSDPTDRVRIMRMAHAGGLDPKPLQGVLAMDEYRIAVERARWSHPEK